MLLLNMLFLEYYRVIKYFTKTILFTVIGFVIFSLVMGYILDGYKVYYFFTLDRAKIIESDDFRYNNYYATQYSDQFTETIKGWFSNPYFIDEILGAYDAMYFSVRKVEKQNISITFTEKNIDDAKRISAKLQEVLQKYIDDQNKVANTDFKIVNGNTYIKDRDHYIYYTLIFISSAIIGFIISLFIVSVIAYKKNIFLLDSAISSIENTDIVGRLSQDNTWINGDWKAMMISGINIDISKNIIDIAKKLSYKYKVCVLNIDFANASELNKLLDVKSEISGITDITNISDISKFIFQDREKKFYILDKGQKDFFDLKDFINNTDFDKIIINLPLPQNYTILKSILDTKDMIRHVAVIQKGISTINIIEKMSKWAFIDVIVV